MSTVTSIAEMVLDRAESQLMLHRGLHSLAGPLLAMLRERMLRENLNLEVQGQPPSLEVAQALEAIDRWNELAEKVEIEVRQW